MSSKPMPCSCIVTTSRITTAAESLFMLFLLPEWKSLVLTGGGAVRHVDPVTVTLAEVSTKTATRLQESVAAR